jgi:hypothetical protein
MQQFVFVVCDFHTPVALECHARTCCRKLTSRLWPKTLFTQNQNSRLWPKKLLLKSDLTLVAQKTACSSVVAASV